MVLTTDYLTALSVPQKTFLGFGLSSFFLACLYVWITPNVIKDTRRRHMPPGPRGLPFIGNLLDLSKSETVRYNAISWAKQYGEVFYTRVGGSDYIWLSSPKAVKDLMDKRSAIYSSRPPAPLAQDVASGGRRQVFMAYGPQYRTVRKISHALLNVSISTSYQPIQDLESKQLLRDILNDPDRFYDHNRRYSASVIITITYGHRIPNWDDELVKKIYSVLGNLQKFATPGAWLVDSFPSLQYLPQWLLGNWRSFGEACHAHDAEVYLELWENLKKEVAAGTANPCFCKDFLESNPEKSGIDNLQAAYQAGGLVEAGAETTSAFINTALLFLVKNPKAVKKAQEELDRVVGSDRMPTWEDEKNLPYNRAIIKETLRVRPPNKVGMHHATTEDDWYEGMFIPKGSFAILNWWAINNDERFDQPSEFKPERYLNHELPAATYINAADPNERDHVSYGAGRRVCPGVHVAEKSLFINLTRILWAFNLTKKIINGKVVEPDEEMVPGWLSVPARFECDITVRSEKHKRLIEEAWDGVQDKI